MKTPITNNMDLTYYQKCLMLLLLLVAISNSLLSQTPEQYKAIELYKRGMMNLKNNELRNALGNFKQSYNLYNHSEIAYAVSYACSKLRHYDEMKKYAKFAINGIPKLDKQLEENAWVLFEWEKPENSEPNNDGIRFTLHAQRGFQNVQRPANELSVGELLAQTITLKGHYSIQQISNKRFLDAHESSHQDFRVVTRPDQKNSSQVWILKHLGGDYYSIQQMSSSQYLDAHENEGNDWAVVTRPIQNDDTQKWIIIPLGGNMYSIQQKSNGRYLDAHESSDQDFSVVIRPSQNNDSQRWSIRKF